MQNQMIRGKLTPVEFQLLMTALETFGKFGGGEFENRLSMKTLSRLRLNCHRPWPEQDYVVMRGSIDLLANLVQFDRQYLSGIDGIDDLALSEIEEFLKKMGLQLDMRMVQNKGEWYLFTRAECEIEERKSADTPKNTGYGRRLKSIKESIDSATRILATPESELTANEVKNAASQATQAASELYTLHGMMRVAEDE